MTYRSTARRLISSCSVATRPQLLTGWSSLVRRTDGDERDAARAHLLELLDLVGNEVPEVLAARRALASALF